MFGNPRSALLWRINGNHSRLPVFYCDAPTAGTANKYISAPDDCRHRIASRFMLINCIQDIIQHHDGNLGAGEQVLVNQLTARASYPGTHTCAEPTVGGMTGSIPLPLTRWEPPAADRHAPTTTGETSTGIGSALCAQSLAARRANRHRILFLMDETTHRDRLM